MITIMTTKYLKNVEVEKKILTDQIIELANTNANEEVLTKPTQAVDSFNVKVLLILISISISVLILVLLHNNTDTNSNSNSNTDTNTNTNRKL